MTTQVVQAVVITACMSLIVAGILFYMLYRYNKMARRIKKGERESSFRREGPTHVPRVEFRQHGGRVRGIIVDEEGLDVLYLRKLEAGCFSKVWCNPMMEDMKRMDSREEKPSVSELIQEIPMLQEQRNQDEFEAKKMVPGMRSAPSPPPTPSHLVESFPVNQTPPPPPPPGPPSPPPLPSLPKRGSVRTAPPGRPKLKPAPPPPPSLPQKGSFKTTPAPVAPPPPSLPQKGSFNSTPAPLAPPPPGPPNMKPAPPPPQAKTRGLTPSHKPPVAPRFTENRYNRTEGSDKEIMIENGDKMKLKPLHWDKVIANADHSMVWNEINDGSFRFDDGLMEALFGYTPSSNKTTEKCNRSSSSSSYRRSSNAGPSAQIFLLDLRKSQNLAIILKSLAVSRKEILDALLEGRGLNAETIEKLTKICPTQEETNKILQYSGNPTKLADAESFLYYILKAVPSAFVRLDAMLFRATYDTEILHLKESLQTLELACKELRGGGVFFKLLEAILKAGNRMNAGTTRGNAQGFNLTALHRLSDVKSTDGKTTLLHFVVEQVVHSEGKRSLINRTREKKFDHISETKNPNQERDREHLMLGLPAVESLNTDFSNVKKAATIDYESLITMCSILTTRVDEIKHLLNRGNGSESGGFVREMKGFVEDCQEELSVVREEDGRVMELVRKTTVYYQTCGGRDKGRNPLQLFVIVEDFLNNVDQVCAEIRKKVQKIKVGRGTSGGGPSTPLSPTPRSPVRFLNLQTYFTAQRHGTSSSDSDDDF